MKTAPVLLFCYNRPVHLARTIEALRANRLAAESDLFIFSDAPARPAHAPDVARVRELIARVEGFRTVTVSEQTVNRGLAASVIEEVTRMVKRFGRVIVLEDDLVTSPFFLTFMNEGLELYAADPKVMNVQAHVLHTRHRMPETFFIRFANSWGWGTWERAWNLFEADGTKLLERLERERLTRRFDFDGRYPFTRMLRRQIAGLNHSWAIRWNATVFLEGGLSLNAGRSLVRNIGTDGSGTNFTSEAGYFTVLDTKGPVCIDPSAPLVEDADARHAIGKVFAYEYSKITKGVRLLRKWWRRAINPIQ